MSAAIIAQAGAGLFQFLQQAAASATSGSSSNTSAGSTANSSSGASSAFGHHHKHGGGSLTKLANAITSALQTATSTGSTGADANQTITEALTKIFSNGSLGSANQTSSTSTDASDSTSDTDDTASSSTSGLPDSFVQTLKSFGVTAQQFQTDLSSALKAAEKSGSFDVSNAFKSFPTGSVVDAVG